MSFGIWELVAIMVIVMVIVALARLVITLFHRR